MGLKDILDEMIYEGVIEGNGTAIAVGFLLVFLFGGLLTPILAALIDAI